MALAAARLSNLCRGYRAASSSGASAVNQGAAARGSGETSATQSFGAIDNPRRQKDHELASCIACAAALEQKPEQRNVAEKGDLVQVATRIAGEDATDDCRVTVHHEQIRLGFTLQDRWIATCGSLIEVRLVAIDLHVHADAAVGCHVRLDEQLQLGFLKRRLNALRTDLRERNQRALGNPRLAVVERENSRAAQDTQQTAGLRG